MPIFALITEGAVIDRILADLHRPHAGPHTGRVGALRALRRPGWPGFFGVPVGEHNACLCLRETPEDPVARP